MEEKKKVCFLCGEEDKDGKDLSDWIEGDEVYACYDCLAQAAIYWYENRQKKSKWRTKINWGFWLLIGGFIAFLITWFIIKPRLGG